MLQPADSRTAAPVRAGSPRFCGGAAATLLAFALAAGWSAAQAGTLRIEGDQGYVPQDLRKLAHGTEIDAGAAMFRVANSGTAAPTPGAPCESGALPVNRYPLQIRDSPDIALRSGLFAGEVPQSSDWQSTYCNSAALSLRGTPRAAIEDVRMRRVWDGLRAAEGSAGFRVSGLWLSEVRDDCVENDYLHAGRIADSLLDGCFSGISMSRPKDADRTADADPLLLQGLLMRMQSYPYKGAIKQGVPFKVDADAPEIWISDSVIAMTGVESVSRRRLGLGWERIGRCRDNLLLWTADVPWPRAFPLPPDCFRLVEGAPARALWSAARQNWINCHPMARRFPDDPRSVPADCDPAAPGGGVD